MFEKETHLNKGLTIYAGNQIMNLYLSIIPVIFTIFKFFLSRISSIREVEEVVRSTGNVVRSANFKDWYCFLHTFCLQVCRDLVVKQIDHLYNNHQHFTNEVLIRTQVTPRYSDIRWFCTGTSDSYISKFSSIYLKLYSS